MQICENFRFLRPSFVKVVFHTLVDHTHPFYAFDKRTCNTLFPENPINYKNLELVKIKTSFHGSKMTRSVYFIKKKYFRVKFLDYALYLRALLDFYSPWYQIYIFTRFSMLLQNYGYLKMNIYL